MAITTRAGKGSSLTHAELDANFTTLGLAHGDTVADLDVSSIIVQGSLDARGGLDAKGTNFNDIHFVRVAGTGDGTEDLVSMLLETDYSVNSHNLANNQAAGFFGWIRTANKSDALGGGAKWVTDNVVDTNNFNTYVQLTCYDTVAGSRSEVIYELKPDRAVIPKSVYLTPMTSTERDALTAADGMVIYNSTTNRFEFRQNGGWVYYSATAV